MIILYSILLSVNQAISVYHIFMDLSSRWETIGSARAYVLYLPPYSPDMNPIEMMWSKIKSLLRKWKARSSETLNQFIEEAFLTITTENIDQMSSMCISNWLHHTFCQYLFKKIYDIFTKTVARSFLVPATVLLFLSLMTLH